MSRSIKSIQRDIESARSQIRGLNRTLSVESKYPNVDQVKADQQYLADTEARLAGYLNELAQATS